MNDTQNGTERSIAMRDQVDVSTKGKNVIVADTVSVQAGEIEIIRDSKGRIARLRRRGVAGGTVVPWNDPPPLDRDAARPRRDVTTSLDPHEIPEPPPIAVLVLEECIRLVKARGVALPARLTWRWASAPADRPHDGTTTYRPRDGAIDVIVNLNAPDLVGVVFHELSHVADYYRYGARYPREELEARARRFVRWMRTPITPPPPPPEPAEYAFHVGCGPNGTRRYPCS